MVNSWVIVLSMLLIIVVLAALPFLPIRRSNRSLRRIDRETVWPQFRFHMQDRDHAIAAMTMYMLMNEHWLPDNFDDCESPFFLVLEQAIEETAGWGRVGPHIYNVPIDAEQVPDKEGFLRGS